MTRTETLAIMSVLKAAYPSFYRDMKRDDAAAVVDLWTDMFADDPVALVAAAVKALIASDTKGFPPHIGAVKEHMLRLTSPQRMTEAEAWAIVLRAISRSGYNSREEFEALPPLLQKLVGSPNQLREWGMMDSDVVQSVVASNFQRSYRVREQQEREYAVLPRDVKALVKSAGQALALEEDLEAKEE